MDVDQRAIHEAICGARNLAEQDGFNRHTYGRADDGACGRCAVGCVAGALDEAPVALAKREGSALARAVIASVEGILPEFATPGERDYAERWVHVNDATLMEGWAMVPGRTKAEVLEAFDRAINATAPTPDLSFLSQPEERREDGDLRGSSQSVARSVSAVTKQEEVVR